MTVRLSTARHFRDFIPSTRELDAFIISVREGLGSWVWGGGGGGGGVGGFRPPPPPLPPSSYTRPLLTYSLLSKIAPGKSE